jgi:hypothetical protein
MVLISIVAVWLALALVLGITLGRSIRRADVVELAARASWDADRGPDRSTVPQPASDAVDPLDTASVARAA